MGKTDIVINEELIGSEAKVSRINNKYKGIIRGISEKFSRRMVAIEITESEEGAPYSGGDIIEVSAAEFKYTVSLTKK